MAKEKAVRSITKAFSYRTAGTFSTIAVCYLVTGETSAAFAIGGIEAVSKFLLYFLHERFWQKVKWGRVEENDGIEYNI